MVLWLQGTQFQVQWSPSSLHRHRLRHIMALLDRKHSMLTSIRHSRWHQHITFSSPSPATLHKAMLRSHSIVNSVSILLLIRLRRCRTELVPWPNMLQRSTSIASRNISSSPSFLAMPLPWVSFHNRHQINTSKTCLMANLKSAISSHSRILDRIMHRDTMA